MMTSQPEFRLRLPSYEPMQLRAEFDYYGASRILSDYCGVNLLNKPVAETALSHGWVPDFYNDTDPRIVTGQGLANKEQMLLTSKVSIKDYLQRCGFVNTYAIGLPITYVKEQRTQRLKNSLLVMPAHSLDYTTHSSWKFAEYVEDINSVSKYFEHIYICIHPSCLKQGYWVKEFEAKGFKIIEGVNIYDKNALLRLRYLMSTFEYVTTNSYGSHIAYGSYFGAKVSIYGSYAEFKAEDFEKDPFYISHKDILELSMELMAQEKIEQELSFLFTAPKEAITRVDWGRYEVGAEEKKSPREIRNLLGWTYRKCFIHKARIWISSLRSKYG